MEILLFGGTTEGRSLAQWLDARGSCQVVACCATAYGGQLVSGMAHVKPLVGPLDAAQKERLVRGHDFACIVDATHPFAMHVSESLRALAGEHGIPLLRLERADLPADSCTVVDSVEAAATFVAARPGKVLLTTGANSLEAFVRALPDFAERLYVRVLPVPASVQKCCDLGIPVSHIVAMQGPFSRELNEALLRECAVSMMVTKASGAAGGFAQKVEAALACGVQVVVVGRPPSAAGMSFEQVKRELEERYGA